MHRVKLAVRRAVYSPAYRKINLVILIYFLFNGKRWEQLRVFPMIAYILLNGIAVCFCIFQPQAGVDACFLIFLKAEKYAAAILSLYLK